MIKTPVTVGILFADFLFPQQKFQMLSHLCSNCCVFPAVSKRGSFHSICVKRICVAFRGCL